MNHRRMNLTSGHPVLTRSELLDRYSDLNEERAECTESRRNPARSPRQESFFVNSANFQIRLGILFIVLSAPIFGQVRGPNQINNGLQAVATTSSAQPLAASGNKPDDMFVIGNDDILSINVWKEPDLSRSIQVRSDGQISLPLMGEVQAAGRTPLQLEQQITAKLRDYITKPEVTVMVEQINSKKFNILGQVTKPGSYSIALAPTVVDAIALAGGTRDFAKQRSIYILRQTPNGSQTRIAFNYKDFLKGNRQNVKLEPHDTVVVP
jgi:polysaccharide export outer membrane protein